MPAKHKPIHPGEVLRAEFLDPLGLSERGLAMDTGMTVARVVKLVKGERSLTADTALRLARYFGTTPEFWVNLQARYDLELAIDEVGSEITKHVKPRDAA